MKKIFYILVAFLFIPFTVSAKEIDTEFRIDECKLVVSGSQTGHEATVSIFKDNKLVGFKTNEINNSNYSVDFILTYDLDSKIDITVSNESGTNEIKKSNINIPACVINKLGSDKVLELFDGHDNSIVINDGSLGFEEDDHFELELFDEDKILNIMEQAKGTDEYDYIKTVYDAIKKEIGSYRVFANYMNIYVRNFKNEDIDYSDYNKGFVVKIKVDKEEFSKIKGLKFAVFSEKELKIKDPVEYSYNEETEILSIKIDRPCSVIGYIDNDYNYLDSTNDQTYDLKKDSTLTIRIDAEYKKFLNVFMDEIEVDKKNYTSKSGSTIITFNKDYLQTLTPGEHEIVVNFTDGSAKTVLNVVKKETNPKTGDNIMVFIILLVISGLGLITTIVLKKKAKN